MNESTQGVLDELISILEKIRDNKIYGSVELFFEDGEITQITQRIIRKVKKTTVVKKSSFKTSTPGHKTTKDQPTRPISTLE